MVRLLITMSVSAAAVQQSIWIESVETYICFTGSAKGLYWALCYGIHVEDSLPRTISDICQTTLHPYRRRRCLAAGPSFTSAIKVIPTTNPCIGGSSAKWRIGPHRTKGTGDTHPQYEPMGVLPIAEDAHMVKKGHTGKNFTIRFKDIKSCMNNRHCHGLRTYQSDGKAMKSCTSSNKMWNKLKFLSKRSHQFVMFWPGNTVDLWPFENSNVGNHRRESRMPNNGGSVAGAAWSRLTGRATFEVGTKEEKSTRAGPADTAHSGNDQKCRSRIRRAGMSGLMVAGGEKEDDETSCILRRGSRLALDVGKSWTRREEEMHDIWYADAMTGWYAHWWKK